MPIPNSGRAGECFFAGEALVRGLQPAWPACDEESYDFLCHNGKKTYRIQVKSTRRSALRSMSISLNHHYTKSMADFLAIYVFQLNVFYIIPVNRVKGNNLRLNPLSPACRWRRYKNAWNLLTK